MLKVETSESLSRFSRKKLNVSFSMVPSEFSLTDSPTTPEEVVYVFNCRVCQLSGTEDVISLDCHCKGELSMAHISCMQKWLRSRQSKCCEICLKPIKNVPELPEEPNVQNSEREQRFPPPTSRQSRPERPRDIRLLRIQAILIYGCTVAFLSGLFVFCTLVFTLYFLTAHHNRRG